jgi:hypothetical protein
MILWAMPWRCNLGTLSKSVMVLTQFVPFTMGVPGRGFQVGAFMLYSKFKQISELPGNVYGLITQMAHSSEPPRLTALLLNLCVD